MYIYRSFILFKILVKRTKIVGNVPVCLNTLKNVITSYKSNQLLTNNVLRQGSFLNLPIEYLTKTYISHLIVIIAKLSLKMDKNKL